VDRGARRGGGIVDPMTTTPPHETDTHRDNEDVQPFSRQELRGMLRAPLRMVDLVLGERRRLAANVAQEHRLPSVLLVLVAATAVFALPFGAVLGLHDFWRVAALLLGGVAICVPSLHVFGRYLGARLSWAQTLSVSLSASAVTALFTFAFAPILAFFRATMSDSAVVTPGAMSVLLLVCALAAGIGQLFRLPLADPSLRRLSSTFIVLLIPWVVLYLFITVRLATVLGLIA
jgi:predicted MFS family arabinose efflux permease